MTDNFTSEKELIANLKKGDESAFSILFYRYKDKLLSYSCRFTKSETIAEEIVHDVFVKIWIDRQRIDIQRSFNSYLYTIVRNCSLNFLKKAALDHSLKEKVYYQLDKYRCPPEEQLVYNELTDITEQAIARLPVQRRKIYQMSRKELMNYDEIAAQLGISKFTVKNQLFKALKAIRNYLSAHTELTPCLAYALFLIFD